MKIYLVGGAIRDKILLLPVKEYDWVVTGSNFNEMIKLGFKIVGKNFPVFLHPKTNEEYALARKEKKIGFGHKDFKFNFSPYITIIEDLYRRDITINAIAEDKYGNIIDPFNGINDIKNKIIKHISNSFSEDPLRILRIARFKSYLHHIGFYIHKSTLKLMKNLSKELIYISIERIWKETDKAFKTKNPEYYFYTLFISNSLFVIFPELKDLINFNYNKNIRIFFKIIRKSNKINNNSFIKFSYIFYEIYKRFYINKNIKYSLKIKNFKNLIFNILNRMNFKKNIKLLLINVINNYYNIKNIKFLNYINLFNLIKNLRINKSIDKLKLFFDICISDVNKKIILLNDIYLIKNYILYIFNIINNININNIIINNSKNIKKIIINIINIKIFNFIFISKNYLNIK